MNPVKLAPVLHRWASTLRAAHVDKDWSKVAEVILEVAHLEGQAEDEKKTLAALEAEIERLSAEPAIGFDEAGRVNRIGPLDLSRKPRQ